MTSVIKRKQPCWVLGGHSKYWCAKTHKAELLMTAHHQLGSQSRRCWLRSPGTPLARGPIEVLFMHLRWGTSLGSAQSLPILCSFLIKLGQELHRLLREQEETWLSNPCTNAVTKSRMSLLSSHSK